MNEVSDILKAIGANVAGYYICKAIDFAMKLLFD